MKFENVARKVQTDKNRIFYNFSVEVEGPLLGSMNEACARAAEKFPHIKLIGDRQEILNSLEFVVMIGAAVVRAGGMDGVGVANLVLQLIKVNSQRKDIRKLMVEI